MDYFKEGMGKTAFLHLVRKKRKQAMEEPYKLSSLFPPIPTKSYTILEEKRKKDGPFFIVNTSS